MDIKFFNQDIQDLLETNASGVKVYREAFTHRDSDRVTGYLAWDFDIEYFVECSEYLSGTVEGTLDVMVYCGSLNTLNTLHQELLDILMPKEAGKRKSLGPIQLTNSYLHWVYIDDVRELFAEKTGHQQTETHGVLTSFNIKISA